MPELSTSVVVPAYNEEKAIAGTLSALAAWLDGAGRSWELIVVDNASTDRTREQVAPFLSDPHIRLLSNDANRGKGYSVRRGMLEATGQARLHCDADCAPSLASLPGMLAMLETNDLVVGSRLAPGAELGMRQPLSRRIVGRGFQQCCRAILWEPTRDLFCGFKLWRGEAAQDVFSRITLDGWTYDAEAIALARALGYRVSETGIAWSDREGSRLDMARVFVPVMKELVYARGQVRREAARGRSVEGSR
ncbi:MAG: glycosyltransferase [Solirubrobacterales bacterium]